jgi:hypothetical protein
MQLENADINLEQCRLNYVGRIKNLEQERDALAEALEMITTHTIADAQCENGYSAAYVAKNALATLKGGSHE